jgi:hypothetical protein
VSGQLICVRDIEAAPPRYQATDEQLTEKANHDARIELPRSELGTNHCSNRAATRANILKDREKGHSLNASICRYFAISRNF